MFLFDFILMFAFSYLLVGLLRVAQSVYERLALSLVLMLGFKSLFVFCLITVGVKPAITIQAVLSLVAFLSGAALFKFKKVPDLAVDFGSRTAPVQGSIAVVVLIGGLFLFSMINALFFPVTEGDGVWHEVRGMMLFDGHHFDLATFQYNTYTPLVHLLYVYLFSIPFEKVKVIFPLFYLCLLVIFYHRVYACHKSRKSAAVFTAILGTTPYFWWHSVLPFLNLVTGFYYSTAAIYWYFLLREIFDAPKGEHPSPAISLAMLSGFFFGMAFWARLEFLLYDVLPFVGLILALEQSDQVERYQKKRILLAFSLPLLGVSCLWISTLLTFKYSPGINGYGIMMVWALLAIGVLAYVAGVLKAKGLENRKTFLLFAFALCVLFVAVLAVLGPKSVSLGMAILLGLFRTVFFNEFYLFTFLLVGLLFAGQLHQLKKAEMFLGVFLIAYLGTHFAIYSFGSPKWQALSKYIDAVFVHLGNVVNASGTREMLAFYPIFVFFISGLPRVKESFDAGEPTNIQRFLNGIIVLNILALIVVFGFPRGQFIISHAGLAPDRIMESAGSSDMPNMARETYKILNRIREKTDLSATVFLPPLDGGHRSHSLQRLYPRKLFWGDLPEYKENMNNPPQNSYFVVHPGWHPEYCSDKPTIELNDAGYVMCRWE